MLTAHVFPQVESQLAGECGPPDTTGTSITCKTPAITLKEEWTPPYTILRLVIHLDKVGAGFGIVSPKLESPFIYSSTTWKKIASEIIYLYYFFAWKLNTTARLYFVNYRCDWREYFRYEIEYTHNFLYYIAARS